MKIRDRFLELDALRGIAALIIIAFHFTLGKNFSPYFNLGCVGIDIFFILSGFVIYRYIDTAKNWRIFLLNRFSRLYPAYWCCLTITTAAILLHTQTIYFHNQTFEWTNNILVKYLVNFTMFQYFFSIKNIDGSYWTLTIELLFYLLVALGLLTKKLKHIEWLGLILSILCALYAIDGIATHWFFHKLLIAFPIIGYFNLFYAGIILFKMKTSKITVLRCIFLLSTYIIQCLLFKNCYYNSIFITIDNYCIMLAFIYAIYILFVLNKLTFLIQPILIWFGKVSYPLYLLHSYIGIIILIPFISNVTNSMEISLLLSFGIILFLASLINKYVEIPAMKFLKNRFNSK